MKLIAFIFPAFVFLSAYAAKSPPVKLGTFTKSGVIVGGQVGNGFSILRANKTEGPGGTERFSILYGDNRGQISKAGPGYFHIQIDEKQPRVSIDLAQVQTTTVDPEQLSHIFKDSKIVAATEMTMDPIDLATNISLKLKRPAEVRAKIETQNGAQILVIDLRPHGGRD